MWRRLVRSFGTWFALLAACIRQASCLVYTSTLKIEVACSSGKLLDFNHTTRRYIPEDRNLHYHSYKNLRPSQSVYAFHTLCMRATFLANNIALVTLGKEKCASFNSLQLKRCLQTTKISSVIRHITTNSMCHVLCAQVIGMCELSERCLQLQFTPLLADYVTRGSCFVTQGLWMMLMGRTANTKKKHRLVAHLLLLTSFIYFILSKSLLFKWTYELYQCFTWRT